MPIIDETYIANDMSKIGDGIERAVQFLEYQKNLRQHMQNLFNDYMLNHKGKIVQAALPSDVAMKLQEALDDAGIPSGMWQTQNGECLVMVPEEHSSIFYNIQDDVCRSFSQYYRESTVDRLINYSDRQVVMTIDGPDADLRYMAFINEMRRGKGVQFAAERNTDGSWSLYMDEKQAKFAFGTPDAVQGQFRAAVALSGNNRQLKEGQLKYDIAQTDRMIEMLKHGQPFYVVNTYDNQRDYLEFNGFKLTMYRADHSVKREYMVPDLSDPKQLAEFTATLRTQTNDIYDMKIINQTAAFEDYKGRSVEQLLEQKKDAALKTFDILYGDGSYASNGRLNQEQLNSFIESGIRPVLGRDINGTFFADTVKPELVKKQQLAETAYEAKQQKIQDIEFDSKAEYQGKVAKNTDLIKSYQELIEDNEKALANLTKENPNVLEKIIIQGQETYMYPTPAKAYNSHQSIIDGAKAKIAALEQEMLDARAAYEQTQMSLPTLKRQLEEANAERHAIAMALTANEERWIAKDLKNQVVEEMGQYIDELMKSPANQRLSASQQTEFITKTIQQELRSPHLDSIKQLAKFDDKNHTHNLDDIKATFAEMSDPMKNQHCSTNETIISRSRRQTVEHDNTKSVVIDTEKTTTQTQVIQ